jgi:riboflavin synthase
MFTGIITHTGTITDVTKHGDVRIAIACPFAGELRIGDSVAVNGCCLTVVDGERWTVDEKKLTSPATSHQPPTTFYADLSQETLSCTSPRWQKGASVNLERSLRLGDSLDGHLVTGHVDGVAIIREITPSLTLPPSGRGNKNTSPERGEVEARSAEGGGSHILMLEAPAALSRFIAAKGSVTLDGISLTVNKVDGNMFWVNIIPHTWQATTLKDRKPGEALNLEIDLMARYAERILCHPERSAAEPKDLKDLSTALEMTRKMS